MKLALIGATLVATAAATPALAQEVITNPGRCAQFYSNANCENLGPGNPYIGRQAGQWTAAITGWSTGGTGCASTIGICTNELGGRTGRLFLLNVVRASFRRIAALLLTLQLEFGLMIELPVPCLPVHRLAAKVGRRGE
jgi:hypothetical protein